MRWWRLRRGWGCVRRGCHPRERGDRPQPSAMPNAVPACAGMTCGWVFIALQARAPTRGVASGCSRRGSLSLKTVKRMRLARGRKSAARSGRVMPEACFQHDSRAAACGCYSSESNCYIFGPSICFGFSSTSSITEPSTCNSVFVRAFSTASANG